MSIEENKAITHRVFEEVLNKGNLDVIGDLISPDLIYHTAGQTLGVERLKQTVSLLHTAFSDFKVTIEDLIAEGNKVAIRSLSRGIHTGDFMGISPTGKQATLSATTILRFDKGKVVERWADVDFLGLMQQLGAISP